MKKLIFSKKDTPLGAYLTSKCCGVQYEWGTETQLLLDDSASLNNSQAISRHLARLHPDLNLYPMDILQRSEVDHWLCAANMISNGEDIYDIVESVNIAVAMSDCLVGSGITIADYEVLGALMRNSALSMAIHHQLPHCSRWYRTMHKLVDAVMNELPEDVLGSWTTFKADHGIEQICKAKETAKTKDPSKTKYPAKTKATTGRKEEGRFVDLPGAKEGEVVVRFPPEASGYLHIGHAKAALLNQHYQLLFKGKLIMRFDDTNPAKEDEHFEQVILEDLKLLNIKPDRFTHTSDYFDLMIEKCELLINEGCAYVDDTEPEQMKAERDERKHSKHRDNSVEKNISMWQGMKQGTVYGFKCCVRAKIDMQSGNGCMRDPTIYRCKAESHVKTGDKYKVYPTYDFACPIVDSIEGVTHALRTTEYHDRDDQFAWFIEALKMRPVHIYEYSRLNMNNTVLSKRKLTWFVNERLVDGWDDPRFPTVRGIVRRGMTVEGLKEFIIAQGSSRSVVNMEWDKIWSFNKKVIDAIAPRYTALEKSLMVPVFVEDAEEKVTSAAKHPKDASIGQKTVCLGPKVFIESVDAEVLQVGENATFINWGNLLIKEVSRDSQTSKVLSVSACTNLVDTNYKKTIKLTWLIDSSKSPLTPVTCVDFGHLITKGVLGKDEDFKTFVNKNNRFETSMMGDNELKNLKKGDIIQLQRKGFYIVDEEYKEANLSTGLSSSAVMFYIPDGHIKEKSQMTEATKSSKVVEKTTNTIIESSSSAPDLNYKIKSQGDKVREFKSKKADKSVIKIEVDNLLKLKEQFKDATGMDWKPDIVLESQKEGVKSAASSPNECTDLSNKIQIQGDLIRKLKSEKAEKSAITTEVNALLSLKKQFKDLTGKDWKPNVILDAPKDCITVATSSDSVGAEMNNKVKCQGVKVRDLKSKGADKEIIKTEVALLLKLKQEFKDTTGMDWKPDLVLESQKEGVKSAASSSNECTDLSNKIKIQGDLIRELKSEKAEKSAITTEVNALLSLKKQFKDITGKDWKPDVILDAPKNCITAASSSHSVGGELNNKVKCQCVKVRDLKSKGADKEIIKAEVALLLKLKQEFKDATGMDWKPDIVLESQKGVISAASSSKECTDLSNKIQIQGDLIRKLKSEKAEKSAITTEVNALLSLKKQFKYITGKDWKPDVILDAPKDCITMATSSDSVGDELNNKVKLQGVHVRDLKSKGADKAIIKNEVALLLNLKQEFKDATGMDWKPDMVLEAQKKGVEDTASNLNSKASDVSNKIKIQGDLIRKLKSEKAEKSAITNEVNALLGLKKQFKDLTGKEWKPEVVIIPGKSLGVIESVSKNETEDVCDELNAEIISQGDKIRKMKSTGTDKAIIKKEVDTLLQLKKQFREKSGLEWKPDVIMKKSRAVEQSKPDSKSSLSKTKENKLSLKSEESRCEDGKKVTRLGLEFSKSENLSKWYSQVITKSGMIDYYNVSGCYILRPWSYEIWEIIKNFFDDKIKASGVQNCYFPIFVSKDVLEKEKSHIADFSPEVAWVTRSGNSEMAEPIAIRPTSETVMYPAISEWIQSHRDLPMRLNQWNNVVRWEFKQPTPFLRTREFLWQEGHSAFQTKREATDEVYEILEYYASVYEELLAVPVVKGKKTEKEKFAGGDFTTTTEAFVAANGRAIQGATSHHLGQNFSKMFDITFEDPATKEKQFVYQNSWGITTRTIGVMVMVHGDDKGLVLPPRVAKIQAIIMPVGITAKVTDQEKRSLHSSCDEIVSILKKAGVRADSDYRDHVTPAWKFNHWELKGVPLRLEVGPREVKSGHVFVVRRDTCEKKSVSRCNLEAAINELLITIQEDMYRKAQQELDEHKVLVHLWRDFCTNLEGGNLLLAPFCGAESCEDAIKKDSAREEASEVGAPSMGAKSLCIPFKQPQVMPAATKCIHPQCNKNALYYTLFGRSY